MADAADQYGLINLFEKEGVDNLGFSTQFQHTEKPTLATDYQNGLVTVINGRGERI